MNRKLIRLLRDITKDLKSAAWIWGKLQNDSKQAENQDKGTMVFIPDLNTAMDKIKKHIKGIAVQCLWLKTWGFAEEINIKEGNENDVEDMVQTLSNEARHYKRSLNIERSNAMVFGQKDIGRRIMVYGVERM